MRISDWSSDVCSSDLGRGDAHHAVGAVLAGVAVEVVVQLSVRTVAGEHEQVLPAFHRIVAVDVVEVERQRPGTAQLQPVEDALARIDAGKPGLEPTQGALAELRQRRAIVRWRQHPQVDEPDRAVRGGEWKSKRLKDSYK